MWLLVIIVVHGLSSREEVLEMYNTKYRCVVEKIRIEREMKSSYPKDHDFFFQCRYREKVV